MVEKKGAEGAPGSIPVAVQDISPTLGHSCCVISATNQKAGTQPLGALGHQPETGHILQFEGCQQGRRSCLLVTADGMAAYEMANHECSLEEAFASSRRGNWISRASIRW